MKVLAFLGCIILFAAGFAGSTDLNFSTEPIWEGCYGEYPTGLVWADFNNDGWPDLAVGCGLDVTSYPDKIFLNIGGSLSTEPWWESEYSMPSCNLLASDLDKNGWIDLFVSTLNNTSQGAIPRPQVIYFNSNGLSNSPDWNSQPLVSFSGCLGDPDGDGDLDIAIAPGDLLTTQAQPACIYFNNGGVIDNSPGWQSDIAAYTCDAGFGDFDNDGDLDLVITGEGIIEVAIFYNHDGVLETTPSYNSQSISGGPQLAVGDINGDGFVDIAIAGGGLAGGPLEVMINNGGTFDSYATWQNYGMTNSSFVQLADVDDDNDLDLLAGGWQGQVVVFKNNDGQYSTQGNWIAPVEGTQQGYWADYDEDFLVPSEVVFVGNGSRKLFQLKEIPIHDIISVEVDGTPLTIDDYCYDLLAGWVSLGTAPSSGQEIVISYDYSRDLDLTLSGDAAYLVENIQYIGFLPEAISFSDELYGDGDNLYENGETIEIDLRVYNRTPSMAMGAAVSLFFEDASIIIDDGTAYLGDVVSMDTVGNGDDKLSFTVPSDYASRIDTAFFEIEYNSGADVDTVSCRVALGRTEILLVDDNAGENISSYYTADFEFHCLPYSLWFTEDSGCPGLTVLQSYEIVIWYTGNNKIAPLGTDEISLLKSYMDGGGRLFLTGQGIAEQLETSDQAFLNDYLKSDYIADSYSLTIIGQPGGAVLSLADTAYIYGVDGAYNQTDPDRIAPMNGGLGEAIYSSTSDYSAVSYDGEYKLIFFGFGYEALRNNNERWLRRRECLVKVLQFFDFSMPMMQPTTSNAGIFPGVIDRMIDHNPVFSWIYNDYDEVQQQAYHVQISSDEYWNECDVWDSGPVTSAETEVQYMGDGLSDGQRYYFRVRTFNGFLWSPWVGLGFRMNSVPVAHGLTPAGYAIVEDVSPVLTHNRAIDGEGDEITYSYQLYEDELMTSLIEETYNINDHMATTYSWEITSILPHTNDYFWRVRCSDEYEDGAWSPLAAFVIPQLYICGDANSDEQANVGDAVFIINYVFKGGAAPEPLEAGDANCDGDCNVGDAVYLINYVFKGGAVPCEGCP